MINNLISGHLSEENKNTNLKRYMYTMLTAALFTITMIWKQPKCPSIDEWIKMMQCTFTVENHSAIKK